MQVPSTASAEMDAAETAASSSVVGSTVAVLLLRGASFGIRVLCILAAARKTSPEFFGTISVLFTMAEITRVVADCGIDTTILRNMATERGDTLARSMGAALMAKIVAGGVAGALLLALMLRVSPDRPILAASIALLAFTPLLLTFSANYFIATRRAAAILVPVAVFTALTLVGFVAIAMLSSAPTPLLLVVAGYELLLGAWLLRQAIRMCGVRPVLSAGGALRLARTALPLGIAIATGYTYGKLDVFVLDHFLGKAAVGQYSAWSRVLDPFLFTCGVIAVSAYGHLSSALHAGDLVSTRRIALRYALLSVGVSGGALLAVLLVGPPLATWFLPSYASSVWIGQLLGVLLVIRSVNQILTAILQAVPRRTLIMVISFMNLAVALVATTTLARAIGIAGVAGGLILMEAINFGVQATFVRRSLVAGATRLTGGARV